MARIASLRRCRARPSTGSFFPLPTRHGYVLRRSAPPAASVIAATAAWITAFRSTASRIIGLRRNGAQQTWCNSVAGVSRLLPAFLHITPGRGFSSEACDTELIWMLCDADAHDGLADRGTSMARSPDRLATISGSGEPISMGPASLAR